MRLLDWLLRRRPSHSSWIDSLVRRASVELVDLPIVHVPPAQVRWFRCSWDQPLEVELSSMTALFLAEVNAGNEALSRKLGVFRPHPIRLDRDGTAYRGPYRRTVVDRVLEDMCQRMCEQVDQLVLGRLDYLSS